MQDLFFFSSRRRHTIWNCDWSSDVCSSDLSIARTLITETPEGSATGAAHALQSEAPPTLHSKRPGSVEPKTAEPAAAPGAAASARAIVSVAVQTILHVKAAGVSSSWPKRSVARTRSVWSAVASDQ